MELVYGPEIKSVDTLVGVITTKMEHLESLIGRLDPALQNWPVSKFRRRDFSEERSMRDLALDYHESVTTIIQYLFDVDRIIKTYCDSEHPQYVRTHEFYTTHVTNELKNARVGNVPELLKNFLDQIKKFH